MLVGPLPAACTAGAGVTVSDLSAGCPIALAETVNAGGRRGRRDVQDEGGSSASSMDATRRTGEWW